MFAFIPDDQVPEPFCLVEWGPSLQLSLDLADTRKRESVMATWPSSLRSLVEVEA